VVTEYAKNTVLRKDHVLLIQGSIFEMENQADSKLIAVSHLSDFALGEGFAFNTLLNSRNPCNSPSACRTFGATAVSALEGNARENPSGDTGRNSKAHATITANRQI
jgi:hypothetical protein